jgi:hypothetical protein
MRVHTPVGEYEFRVTGMRFERGRIEVAGSLGQWETTTVIEPSDWLRLGRRAAPAVAALAALAVARRLVRRQTCAW